MTKTTQGILWSFASIAIFTLMDAFVKLIISELNVIQIVWARYGGQMVFVLIFGAPVLRRIVTTNYPKIQLFPALSQLSSSGFFFLDSEV